MKGSNEIKMNQITMVEAIQHYFATVVFREDRVPVVQSVEQGNTSSRTTYATGGEEFIVKVKDKGEQS